MFILEKCSRYKVIVFDLDDTLIDNLENIRYAFRKMTEYFSESYSDEKFEKWYKLDKLFWRKWQDGLIELPEDLKFETGKKSERFLNWVRAQRVIIYFENKISLEEAINLNYVYMKALEKVVLPVEGVFETLKYLSETKRYHILVATNGPKIAAEEKLKKIKCRGFIEEVFSADMVGYMKPRKEFFDAIELKFNYKKDEFLVVGDSLKSDIGLAEVCKIDSCWFDKKGDRNIGEYNPTLIINKLIELKNML